MSLLYRVLRRAYAQNPFDGEGAYRFGGRWSSPGIRLSYTSQHQSLAMLEYFLHLDKDNPPGDLVLAVAEVPNNISETLLRTSDLPQNWRESLAPTEIARFGDEFFQHAKHCLLRVPSVLAPREHNVLMNPAHADFKKIVVMDLEPLFYDERMFAPKRGPRRAR